MSKCHPHIGHLDPSPPRYESEGTWFEFIRVPVQLDFRRIHSGTIDHPAYVLRQELPACVDCEIVRKPSRALNVGQVRIIIEEGERAF